MMRPIVSGRFLLNLALDLRGLRETVVARQHLEFLAFAKSVIRRDTDWRITGLNAYRSVVRKLGVPGYGELAMGAIASGGVRVLNEDVVAQLPNAEEMLAAVTAEETRELERREAEYRGNRPPPDLRGKTVILVDDGLATGATMRAAATALKQRGVAACVVGVPVASPETCAEFRHEVDEVVCAATPEPFYGVGQFYEDFSQTSDEEVRELLARAATEKTQS